MVLMGVNHYMRRANFFRDLNAVQLTECFQFVQRLQNVSFMIPHFQAYKLLYAYTLVEYGFVEESQK
jgi:hypothetical protein